MKRFWMRRVAGFIVLALLGITVFSGIVMLLWNALMPAIFHLSAITWLQALGLLILSKILFGGFRGGGPRHHWKDKMKQNWMKMTPEQKEKFRQEWMKRCGGRGPFSDEKVPPTESAS
jgi:hypothetical protein